MSVPASFEERPLIIPMPDLRSLRAVVVAARPPHPRAEVAAWLAEELDRATVVSPEAVPAKVVTMHARVAYRDDVTDHVACVTLVYPGEEDAEVPAVSVLSPVGAALLGLSEGHSIRWRTASGGLRGLTAVRVLFQPYEVAVTGERFPGAVRFRSP